MKSEQTGRKLRRRALIQQVALEFRRNLRPRPPAPKMITRGSRRTVPHYKLAEEAIGEFIEILGAALADNRPVILRRFGRFVPRRYKPMRVKMPRALAADEEAVFEVPVRLGVQFRPSPKLKEAIRKHDEAHGLGVEKSGDRSS